MSALKIGDTVGLYQLLSDGDLSFLRRNGFDGIQAIGNPVKHHKYGCIELSGFKEGGNTPRTLGFSYLFFPNEVKKIGVFRVKSINPNNIEDL